MKNLYSRLVLIFSILVITGYLIVSAAWVPMNNNATTGTQLTATIWNNLVGNVNDLDTRVGSIISSLWSTGATNSINYTAGNVGIGTIVPNKLLHLKTTTGTNAELDIQSGEKGFWGIYQDEASEELRFWNGANRVMFGSGGNVGIGVTSPVNKFEVDGGASITMARISSTNTSGSAAGLIISNSTKTAWNDGLQIIHGAGTTKFNDLAGTNVMSLDLSNARVGIGTQSPVRRLHVIEAGNGYSAVFGGISQPSFTIAGFDSITNGVTAIGAGTDSSRLGLYTGTDLSGGGRGNERLSILSSNGNVGIGTINPSAKLHVESTAAGVIKYTNGGTSIIDIGNANGLFGIGTTNDAAFYATANLYFMSNGGSTKLAMVDGNVGIGTTGPSQKLEVMGTVLADAHTTHSDIRYKKDISTLTGALDRVLRIRGVGFLWKDIERNQTLQMGVIAQEVEQVFPEIVTTAPNGYKSVAYDKLVAPLIEAVKELKKENNEMKSLVCLDHPSAKICQ